MKYVFFSIVALIHLHQLAKIIFPDAAAAADDDDENDDDDDDDDDDDNK
jgi:hypothetical protein